jgi:hypothetical protein
VWQKCWWEGQYPEVLFVLQEVLCGENAGGGGNKTSLEGTIPMVADSCLISHRLVFDLSQPFVRCRIDLSQPFVHCWLGAF